MWACAAEGARFISLDAKDFDVGVFLGDPPDSSLVARCIARRWFRTFATRDYLDRHGTPRIPQDLAAHNCLLHVPPHGRPQSVWSFQKDGQACDVTVSGNLCVNDGPPLIAAVRAGLGIARLPSNNVDPLLAADSDEQAQYLATSAFQRILALIRGQSLVQRKPVASMEGLWLPHERQAVSEFLGLAAIGGPQTVRQRLEQLLEQTEADELIFTCDMYDFADRLHAFDILAELQRG